MGRRSGHHADGPAVLIVVDTSVWIDRFRGRGDLPHVCLLTQAIEANTPILVGDMVMLELLLGVSDERQAAGVEASLRTFHVEAMMQDGSTLRAARNYRRLRAAGVTVRKTVDLIIGTFCIDRGYRLLHNDLDFEPMHALLGLRRA